MAQGNAAAAPRRALVVGGSIAGLIAAVQLRRIGWDVDVFERSAVALSGRGAGIMTHPELVEILEQSGADCRDLGVPIHERIMVDRACALRGHRAGGCAGAFRSANADRRRRRIARAATRVIAHSCRRLRPRMWRARTNFSCAFRTPPTSGAERP